MTDRTRIPVSHLLPIQVARFVGVAKQSVFDRIQSGKMATITVLGSEMVSVGEARRWVRERRKTERARAHAAHG